MANESILCLGGLLILITLFITWYRSEDSLLEPIPTPGFSDPILSYLSAFHYEVLGGATMIKNGYRKSKPGLFRISFFKRWMVLPTSVKLIDDVRKASDNILSASQPFREFLQMDYTLNLLNNEDTYERAVIRSRLTRNVATTFDQAYDELDEALREFIPATCEEWAKVSILPAIQRIICRTSNRIFVGTPLCRNHDYQTLMLDFRGNLVKSAIIIGRFPKPLKPIVARIFSNLPSQVRSTMEFIRPLVEERFAKMQEFGETWDDAPNDLLMWLMNEAKGIERLLEGLARRLLLVNLASIHSTSLRAVQALYYLLSNPEYIEPLRQEVQTAVAEEGWTNAGMDKMHKIDSFLKETLRVDGQNLVSSIRLVLRPFTFSNGATIPADTLVALPLCAIHEDDEIYPHPEEFDGFRFWKLREKKGDVAAIKRPVTTSADLLVFGIGRHACPGRFLAVNEIKALLAYIIVTYEFKLMEGKGVPGEHRMGLFRNATSTDILFRKRQK